MLGCSMLNAINKRLQQAFPLNSDQPNGGCDLILFEIIQEKDTGDLFVTYYWLSCVIFQSNTNW